VRLVRSLLDAGAPSGLAHKPVFGGSTDPIRLADALVCWGIALCRSGYGRRFPPCVRRPGARPETCTASPFPARRFRILSRNSGTIALLSPPRLVRARLQDTCVQSLRPSRLDRWWTRAKRRTGKDGFLCLPPSMAGTPSPPRPGRPAFRRHRAANDRGAALLTLRLPPAAPQAAPNRMATAPTTVEPTSPPRRRHPQRRARKMEQTVRHSNRHPRANLLDHPSNCT
jgi:hypothetical protein